jgi:DNA-binding NarL/FixJ family response regulator
MAQDVHIQDQSFPPEWLARALVLLNTLTDRQHATLLLLGLGMNNFTIAHELSCSERTVKQHITDIFDRLGVRSRLQAGLVGYHYQIHKNYVPAPSGLPTNDRTGAAESTEGRDW